MRGLPDIPGAGVRDVGAAPGAGRESNVSVELPRHRPAVPDAAAPGMRVLRSHMQVDVLGGVVRRHRGGRDHVVRRRSVAYGQSAFLVPEDQPHAVVVVAAVAAFAQKREHGKIGQLQAEANPTAGHHHPGGLRAARRRVSPPGSRS